MQFQNFIIMLTLSFPDVALAGRFRAHLDDAIIPSLISGIVLLLIVQGGHYIICRMRRVIRFKLVSRQRRQRH
jgi:hypothetical protein